jgi:hypothetical protein
LQSERRSINCALANTSQVVHPGSNTRHDVCSFYAASYESDGSRRGAVVSERRGSRL